MLEIRCAPKLPGVNANAEITHFPLDSHQKVGKKQAIPDNPHYKEFFRVYSGMPKIAY